MVRAFDITTVMSALTSYMDGVTEGVSGGGKRLTVQWRYMGRRIKCACFYRSWQLEFAGDLPNMIPYLVGAFVHNSRCLTYGLTHSGKAENRPVDDQGKGERERSGDICTLAGE